MQSRRTWLPVVEPISLFTALADRPGAALADRAGAPPTLQHPTVLIGPEGGWSETERARGLPRMGLGSTVLRAETAALVAGSALCGLRSALFESVDGHAG
jgi:RsmE family RNA methyltransferase